MKAESSKLPANYLQPAPVRGQLEPPNQRSAPGWRYIQCTDTPNQFRVLLPPRTSEHYEQLLRAEVYELAKQPNLSWERILEIRHLKDRMIRKCQRLSKIVPNRKVNPTPGGFAPQTAVAPTDFRLKEMEKWLRTHQHTKPSSHHHHHHSSSHTHSARKKTSFEQANPTKSYCCVGCQQPNRHHHHHRPGPSYPDLRADALNDDEAVGRQAAASPPPAVSPRSTRATAGGTPRPRSSLSLRRASTGSATNLHASPAAGPSRSPSLNHGPNHNSPYGHSIPHGVRASRDNLSDSSSGEDLPQRHHATMRNPALSDKGKAVARRMSMSSILSPPALSPSAVPGSPPPLPIPYRPSLLFGAFTTEEPIALQSDPPATEPEPEPPAEQGADPVLSSSPPEDSTDQPRLRRRRSCIKRNEGSGEVKTVSWAVTPDIADDISKYVEAAADLEVSGKQYEEMRFSYIGHVKALDLLHVNVASSLDRLRAETMHLETLQEDIRIQREQLELSYDKLEQKHQSMKDRVEGLLNKQPSGS